MIDVQIIWVYADWKGLPAVTLVGKLIVQYSKGHRTCGFEFDPAWLTSHPPIMLDPDLLWFGGIQYPTGKPDFGAIMDSMPDTWGRTLMKRKAAGVKIEQALPGSRPPVLSQIDFLLGVHDKTRSGALRFKTDPEGPFLDDDDVNSIPPWASVRTLQYAAAGLEKDGNDGDIDKWLTVLMAPGSSLGGARPKANILDEYGHPWIAKFPSGNDTIDKAAWEFLTYKLATMAGVNMAASRLELIAGRHHTFITRRFDREGKDRIHFASAMTMTGHTEIQIRDATPSYLDIVEFIVSQGAQVEKDLEQLWRRIVFNIAVSNTDDHLRNHGFILGNKGWMLSPAYDLNPSIDKSGLALNINQESNALDFALAMSVGKYFRLSLIQMQAILKEVESATRLWRSVAKDLGIPRFEQQQMEAAFRLG